MKLPCWPIAQDGYLPGDSYSKIQIVESLDSKKCVQLHSNIINIKHAVPKSSRNAPHFC